VSERRTIEVSRTARYHVVGGAGAECREVWFVLHGYGQLAGAFLESLRSLSRPARLLIAPEALSRFYLRRGTGEVGASWMTKEAREDEIADTVHYLERLWEHVRAEHGLAPAVELCAFGFSQGGAAAARWAVLGGAPVARVTLWGCPLPLDLELASRPERVRRLRWSFVLGASDATIDRGAWEKGLERLRALSVEPEVAHPAVGHELEPATLARLGA